MLSGLCVGFACVGGLWSRDAPKVSGVGEGEDTGWKHRLPTLTFSLNPYANPSLLAHLVSQVTACPAFEAPGIALPSEPSIAWRSLPLPFASGTSRRGLVLAARAANSAQRRAVNSLRHQEGRHAPPQLTLQRATPQTALGGVQACRGHRSSSPAQGGPRPGDGCPSRIRPARGLPTACRLRGDRVQARATAGGRSGGPVRANRRCAVWPGSACRDAFRAVQSVCCPWAGPLR